MLWEKGENALSYHCVVVLTLISNFLLNTVFKLVVWGVLRTLKENDKMLFTISKRKNIMWFGRNAFNLIFFLLFPQYFLPLSKTEITLLATFNPFPHNNTFWRPWETSLLKTLREKEKLLVTSNFSFSRSVFYLFGWMSSIFIKFEIVVCKLFQFGRV